MGAKGGGHMNLAPSSLDVRGVQLNQISRKPRVAVPYASPAHAARSTVDNPCCLPQYTLIDGQTGKPMNALQIQVSRLLHTYTPRNGGQQGLIKLFHRFVEAHSDCCERSCSPGHFTASAWLVSGDGQRALLTHHRKLGLWVQPGGHADGHADLAAVALQEAEEESGLAGLCREGGVFDMDCHWIPRYSGDPAHRHYDVCFVVRATSGETPVVSEESLALAWRPVSLLASSPGVDASVQRMAKKWLSQNIISSVR